MSMSSMMAKMQLQGFKGDGGFDLYTRDQYAEYAQSLSAAQINECALEAVLTGNLDLLIFLQEQRGPLRVDFVNMEGGPERHGLNGGVYPGKANLILDHIKSRSRLKSLLKVIAEYGMTGLTEPGAAFPLMFRRVIQSEVAPDPSTTALYNMLQKDFEPSPSDGAAYQPKKAQVSPLDAVEDESFVGHLPYLSDGVVKSPELAMALKHEEGLNPHGAAYKPILCWASKAMVEDFPNDLAHLTPFQEMSGGPGQPQLAGWEDGAWKADYGVVHFTSGVRPSSGVKYADLLMDSLSTEATALGFEDAEGRVLCETTTDFLLSFQLDGITHENTEAARAFAVDYCPFEIMSRQAAHSSIRDFGHDPSMAQSYDDQYTRTIRAGGNELFTLLGNGHPLRESALSMMSRDQWKGIFSQAEGRHLRAQALIAMYQTFGLDNSNLVVDLQLEDIPAFQAAGYRFSDDSKCFDREFTLWQHLDKNRGKTETLVVTAFESFSSLVSEDVPLKGFVERITEVITPVVLDLNLWPSDSLRPGSLTEAIQLAASVDVNDFSSNQSMGLRAILVNAGVEACADVATSPQEWMALKDVFSRDAMTPYLKQMSRAARGKMMEQDLGM